MVGVGRVGVAATCSHFSFLLLALNLYLNDWGEGYEEAPEFSMHHTQSRISIPQVRVGHKKEAPHF